MFRQRWLNLSLRLKGLVVTTLPILALVGFAVSFLAVEVEYRNAGKWLNGALQLFGAMQKVRTSLLEEAGALRAYGLTDDGRYLKTYRDSVNTRDAAMGQLHSLTSANSPGRKSVDRLGELIVQYQAAADSHIASLQSPDGQGKGAVNAMWLEKNRTAMAKIDSEFTALQQAERRAVTVRAAGLARALRLSNLGVVISILLGIGGGTLAMILFASGIVSRIRSLQMSANGLAEGKMPTPQRPTNDEIGQLSESLIKAANLLQERTRDAEVRAQALAESEAANQKQTRLLQCVLDSIGDAVVVADQTGKLVLCNPAAQGLFGEAADLPPERWLERAEILQADTMTPCPLDELPLSRAVRGENPGPAELLVRRQGGEPMWIDVTARALREEHDVARGGVAVIRDVTANKRTEETLRQAREAAENANLAKSEFLSRMSHELRTPLNAILGFAQLLDLDSLSAPQRQSVDQILKGGRHLLTLINEVLDLARIEAGKLSLSTEPVQSGETIRSSIELVGSLAQQSAVTIHVEDSADWQQHVLADRQRFQQVLLNLLSNAIKYNKRGGKVFVDCRTVDAAGLRLTIRDTGAGLTPEKLNRLFRPFERLDSDHYGIEGTGIGLALSKRLVDAMGGVIGVESKVGAGSTFWVQLPICAGPLDELTHFEPDNSTVAAPTGFKTTKLLYIEDNLSNNLLMERILENRPEIQLISAMQGRMGLELAKQHQPDLICLDLHLPDINGDEVLKILRSQPSTSSIPVAMISADATPGQIDRLMAAGANAYFTKPLDVKAILRYVDEALGVKA